MLRSTSFRTIRLELGRSQSRGRFLSTSGESVDEYERKTPHEHVLLRPGMYVGQIDASATDTWIYNQKSSQMEKQHVNYSPALLKIFDEILVNAADNAQREEVMSKLDVSIEKNDRTGELKIRIMNDGKVIPIQKHSKEDLYIPELIFGNLLTGSNFDDSKNSLTGGRHGYGAKLTNIFSKKFEVEIFNKNDNKSYKQTWKDNMFTCNKPKLSNGAEGDKNNYTSIMFEPDLVKFGMDKKSLEKAAAALETDKENTNQPIKGKNGKMAMHPGTALDGTISMMKRRVLDIAACLGGERVKVTLNGEPVPVDDFQSYVNLFTPAPSKKVKDKDGKDITASPVPAYFCKVGDRWEIAVMSSPSGSFENQSFVNAVWTPRGGTHVGAVTVQVANAIEEAIEKSSGLSSTQHMIRNRLMVFVRCAVENPTFDSQSKDALTTQYQSFGSQCILPGSFIKKIVNQSGIVEEIVLDLENREQSKLVKATSNKGMARQVNVPKLEDAHLAGTERSGECSLILTEGDSAKALAVAGLSVVGRDTFGVLPLRGKILNVRGAPPRVLTKNKEITNLVKALGLQFDRKYDGSPLLGKAGMDDPLLYTGVHGQGLRYGKVLIMTDQDNDGAHIKGLLINFFQHFWPSLLDVEGFLQQFITPLVKIKSKGGKGKEKEIKSFYSVAEHEAWLANNIDKDDGIDRHGNFKIKYYKGLGTNTAEEGRAYFNDLKMHRKLFFNEESDKSLHPDPINTNSNSTGDAAGLHDAKAVKQAAELEHRTTSNIVDLAFSKKRAKDRKDWLETRYKPGSYINPHKQHVSVGEFIDTELMQFSFADNIRSLPHVVDGLKPAQRKVLYGCLKKKLHGGEEMKVVQLAGYIAEQTAYHHGDASLHSTIINMAQDYVGSNNMPLLQSIGQFGTRASGGKDFASARYIFTCLSPFARLLYPEADDSQLEFLTEDGTLVEPAYYLPILPMLLVNGSYGIGTGWSSFVPQHDPQAVADRTARLVRGESLVHAPLKAAGKRGARSAEEYQSDFSPYVHGFKGAIDRVNDTRGITYRSRGLARRASRTTIEIDELPVSRWTNDYKKHLVKLQENGHIRRFSENHTHDAVKFILTGTRQQIDALEGKGDNEDFMHKKLKLDSPISLRNMHAFDDRGRIVKYETPESICEKHYEIRLHGYEKRKAALLSKYQEEVDLNQNKSKYVSDIISGDLTILDRRESELISELRDRGFDSSGRFSTRGSGRTGDGDNFNYLLDMPNRSLTEERVLGLKKATKESKAKLGDMQRSSVQDLWMRDLTNFLDATEKKKYQ